MPHPARHLRGGFTIAEIIVAVVITAFVAGATSVALTQAARARDASTAKVEARSRAELAADRIAQDIENAVRHEEAFFSRVKVTNGGSPNLSRDELLIYSRSVKLVRARSEQGEGGEYEVQYRLDTVPRGAPPPSSRTRATTTSGTSLALWRRADPVPDDVPDGGGVAAAIVDGVLSLDIQAYDGTTWFESWESDSEGYPHAVSVQVIATDDTGRYQATCRRVVALDRTPIPTTPVVTDDSSTSTGASGANP